MESDPQSKTPQSTNDQSDDLSLMTSFRYSANHQRHLNEIRDARLANQPPGAKKGPAMADLIREALALFIAREYGEIDAAKSMVTPNNYLAKPDSGAKKAMRGDARDILNEAIGMRSAAGGHIRSMLDEMRRDLAAHRAEARLDNQQTRQAMEARFSAMERSIGGISDRVSRIVQSTMKEFEKSMESLTMTVYSLKRYAENLEQSIEHLLENSKTGDPSDVRDKTPEPQAPTLAPAEQPSKTSESPGLALAPAESPAPRAPSSRSSPPISPAIKSPSPPESPAAARHPDKPAPLSATAPGRPRHTADQFDWGTVWENEVTPFVLAHDLPEEMKSALLDSKPKARLLSNVIRSATPTDSAGILSKAFGSFRQKKQHVVEVWPVYLRERQAPNGKDLVLWLVLTETDLLYCFDQSSERKAFDLQNRIIDRQSISFLYDDNAKEWKAEMPDGSFWVV